MLQLTVLYQLNMLYQLIYSVSRDCTVPFDRRVWMKMDKMLIYHKCRDDGNSKIKEAVIFYD
jgi:hypothetical protein